MIDLLLGVPLLVSCVLAVVGPALGRRSALASAARLIPLTCLLVAASTLVSLAGVAVVVVARVAALATFGRLSVRALPAAYSTVPVPVGVAVAAVVVALVTRAALQVLSMGREVAAGRRLCRSLERRPDGAYLIDDDRPRAFAVAGLRDRVVLSTGMLRELSVAEQAAVLAHERAHLRRRHHVSLAAARIAAAVDPLLIPMRLVTAHAVEREADEDAAAAIGDRRTVARALARAGLAAINAGGSPEPTLAMAAGDVPRRVAALLAPPVAARRWVAPVVLAMSVLAAGTMGIDARLADHHIDHARAVYAGAAVTTGHRAAHRELRG